MFGKFKPFPGVLLFLPNWYCTVILTSYHANMWKKKRGPRKTKYSLTFPQHVFSVQRSRMHQWMAHARPETVDGTSNDEFPKESKRWLRLLVRYKHVQHNAVNIQYLLPCPFNLKYFFKSGKGWLETEKPCRLAMPESEKKQDANPSLVPTGVISVAAPHNLCRNRHGCPSPGQSP